MNRPVQGTRRPTAATPRSVYALLLAQVVAALSMCCASGAELQDPQLAGPFALHRSEREPSRCGMAFDPSPELLRDTLSAAARWSAATGCDIRVEAGGIPLVAEDYVSDPEGADMCGLATWDSSGTHVDVIEIAMVDLACLPPYTVLHEMGHALAGIQGHTLSGVMASAKSKDKSTRIDEPSLQLVCYGLHCAAFIPEESR